MNKVHVVALGNRIMSDDGLGPRLLDAVSPLPWPKNVYFHQRETSGTACMEILKGNGAIMLVDALRSGHRPGTVVKIRADKMHLDDGAFSLHDMHLLHLAYRFYPQRLPHICIFGIEPDSLTCGNRLSLQVSRTLPLLARALAREIIKASHSNHPSPSSPLIVRRTSFNCSDVSSKRRACSPF